MKLKPKMLIFVFGLMLTGCRTRYQLPPENSSASTAIPQSGDTLDRLQDQGIDFVASGSAPRGWNLRVDFDRSFIFSAENKISVIASPAAAKATMKSSLFDLPSGDKLLNVEIFTAACNTGARNRTTTVRWNNEIYSGCGEFLVNKFLQNTWKLMLINNDSLKHSDFKGKNPFLHFDIESGEFRGYDGCTTIRGTFTAEGNRMKFSSFSGSGKSCREMRTAALIQNLVAGNTLDYVIKGKQLNLLLPDDSRLTFEVPSN